VWRAARERGAPTVVWWVGGGRGKSAAERPIKTESARAFVARGGVVGAGPIAVQFVAAGARGAQWRPGAPPSRFVAVFVRRRTVCVPTLTSTGLECDVLPVW